MNEVRLVGEFATEVGHAADEGGGAEASFIISVARNGGGEDLFRVRCRGEAATMVFAAAEDLLLRGRVAEVIGSLRQEPILDDTGQEHKTVFVLAEGVRVGEVSNERLARQPAE